MVHSGTHTANADKSLQQRLVELQKFRNIQHRTFTRFSDGDVYTVLMFAHDVEGNLNVVYAMCALPQIKEVLPLDLFLAQFTERDLHYQPKVGER